mgnify:CR=1 FL=1
MTAIKKGVEIRNNSVHGVETKDDEKALSSEKRKLFMTTIEVLGKWMLKKIKSDSKLVKSLVICVLRFVSPDGSLGFGKLYSSLEALWSRYLLW